MTSNPDYANIFNICELTGQSFDTVLAASRRLGLRPPFNFRSASILCRSLVGIGLMDLRQIKIYEANNDTGSIQLSSLPTVTREIETTSQALRHGSINTRNEDSPQADIQSNSSKNYLYLPNSLFGSGPWLLRRWLVNHGQEVTRGQPLVRVWRYDREIHDVLYSGNSGTLQHLKDEDSILKVGDMFGLIISGMHKNLFGSDEDSPFAEIQSNSMNRFVYLPKISYGSGPYILSAWLVDHGQEVTEGQSLVKIWKSDVQSHVNLTALDSGILNHIKEQDCIIEVGDVLGTISSISHKSLAESSSEDSSLASLPEKRTTSEALRVGVLSGASGSIPQFQPSVASEPIGFTASESPDQDFIYALSNHRISFQSFYNDVDVIASSRINDDVISLPCFDEALYCALVREMHRYSLAEIADNKADLANKNAGLGAMVGSLLGVITGNIFAPFLGHSYGKNISTSNKRVEEFLPDPNLLFYQDENSYLSWSKAQVSSPRLRRLIFDRRVKANGNVFYRLIPAIVTSDSVFPIQLFKIDSSTYFYRPFSAGIERDQPHYDSVKIQKRYFHLRGEGTVSETDMKVCVSGRDVEEYESKIFRFQGSSLDYFYLDFKTSPGSVF